MGITKHLNFDLETKAIGKICKALGHPTRIEIMTLELKKANLVNIKNEGKKTIYSLGVENIEILKKYLTSYLSTIEISEQNKSTVLTTRHEIRTRNSHLKQYNYQFLDKKLKQVV